MKWTIETIAQLAAWWREGKDASWIGAQWKCSRSTVLGKIHRLRRQPGGAELFAERRGPGGTRLAGVPRWPPKSKPKPRPKSKPKPKPKRKPAPITTPPPTKPKPKPQPKPVVLLPSPVRLVDASLAACRYILGDPAGPDTLYCGHRRMEGLSYCDEHAQRCVPGKFKAAA